MDKHYHMYACSRNIIPTFRRFSVITNEETMLLLNSDMAILQQLKGWESDTVSDILLVGYLN